MSGNEIIINETAAEELGIDKDPLGKQIFVGDQNKYEVVGVVKDFHFTSLQQAIAPLVMFPVKDTQQTMFVMGGYLTVRLAPTTNLMAIIAHLEKIYQKYESGKPFDYFFLDNAFDQLYKYQDRLANLSSTFTIFAVLISCLGLFGLTAFTTEHRTKEIGIRKVLGASATNIVTSLTKDFMRLVLFAFFLSVPIAWIIMQKWLQDYAYKIQIEWWIFALAGTLALFIALVTISYQSIKAALANPVDSLRNE